MTDLIKLSPAELIDTYNTERDCWLRHFVKQDDSPDGRQQYDEKYDEKYAVYKRVENELLRRLAIVTTPHFEVKQSIEGDPDKIRERMGAIEHERHVVEESRLAEEALARAANEEEREHAKKFRDEMIQNGKGMAQNGKTQAAAMQQNADAATKQATAVTVAATALTEIARVLALKG